MVIDSRPRVLIFGSYIVAMVMQADRLPGAGETVVGRGFRQAHGGKGSNMAVQAARLGADVRIAAVIGQDAPGDAWLATLAEERIATHGVRRSDRTPTGTGFIVVDAAGRNVIVIDPGANLDFTPAKDFDRLAPELAGCQAAVAVLEIPLVTALHGLARAKVTGARTILNPAPATDLRACDLSCVDILTPNESEARICLGLDPSDKTSEDELAACLMDLGVGAVVFTRGERGALMVSRTGRIEQAAVPVTVVDTVGAGDSFNAALATAIGEGRDDGSALRFACTVASLSTTRRDTLPSYFRRAEVDAQSGR